MLWKGFVAVGGIERVWRESRRGSEDMRSGNGDLGSSGLDSSPSVTSESAESWHILLDS